MPSSPEGAPMDLLGSGGGAVREDTSRGTYLLVKLLIG